MLNKCMITTALVGICAVAGADAQTPPLTTGQQQDRPGGRIAGEPYPSAKAATATVVGCVYREADVPGGPRDVPQRAEGLNDYILAIDEAPTGSTPGATGTSGTPSASGTGAMYKLEHAKDEQLRPLVGKRVAVTGRIDAKAKEHPDRIERPEFEVSSIREVAGTCPANPAIRE